MTRQKFGEAYECGGYEGTVRFLQRKGVDRDVAEEIAQSAWAKGWQHISKLLNDAAVATWVNVIALNILRSSLRRKRLMIADMAHEPAVSPSIDLVLIDVRAALKGCKQPVQQIIEASLQGCSAVELAAKSGRSLGAIHAEMYRARNALKEQMKLPRRQFLPDEGVLKIKAQREKTVRSKAPGRLRSTNRTALKRAS